MAGGCSPAAYEYFITRSLVHPIHNITVHVSELNLYQTKANELIDIDARHRTQASGQCENMRRDDKGQIKERSGGAGCKGTWSHTVSSDQPTWPLETAS
jgi:hypothetical protein